MLMYNTFYIVESNDSIYTIPRDPDKSLDWWFTQLAHTIAFDDCSGERILFISYEGKEIRYAGWKPGMLMEFEDKEGNTIWSQAFPEWDH